VAWPILKEIFYDHFGQARPNGAHLALARLEAEGRLKILVTQNIDNLRNIAGGRTAATNPSRLVKADR
jgi:NAD-dependent deacetylase